MSDKYEQVRPHARVYKSSSQSGLIGKGRSVASTISGPGFGAGGGSGSGVGRHGTSASVSSAGRASRDRERRSDRRADQRGSKTSVFEDEATRMNSHVCKRMDPNFLKIIKVASQVALYEYDCHTEKWASVGINGCLFFYERSELPTFGLFILNRSNLNNFVQLLTPDIEVQVVMPHILMNNREVIRCFWFYKESECIQLAADICNKLNISLSLPQPSDSELAEPELDAGDRLHSARNNASPTDTGSQKSQSDNLLPGNGEGSRILSLLCNYKPTFDDLGATSEAGDASLTLEHVMSNERTESNEISLLRQELASIRTTDRHEDKDKLRLRSSERNNSSKSTAACGHWEDASAVDLQGFQSVPNLFSTKLEMPVLEFETQDSLLSAPAASCSTLISNSKEPVQISSSNTPPTGVRRPTPTTSAMTTFLSSTITTATPSYKLDSLGEELRATLGITNRRADTVSWMSEGNCKLDASSKLKDMAREIENGLTMPGLGLGHPINNWESCANEQSDASTHDNDDQDADGLRGDAEEMERLSREQYERRKQEIFERERRDAAVQALGRQRDFVDDVAERVKFLHQPSTHHMDHHFPPNTQSDYASRFVLNKHQMVQAMLYLLKTDADFTDKLHKAYLSSLSLGNDGY